ncbi:unnamed protein product [Cercopithifilaria johnstoni]|uniref:Uncharacterized protein n=1 Tax=Cercopithifilaria johnstoni TaxID=2874296 RepID=A0A8J2MGW5_9BILA|nr:unnamed protein product [Cercopithifilaria johnstoni]
MEKMNETKLIIEKNAQQQGSLLDLQKVFKNYNVYRSLPSSTFQKEESTHAHILQAEKQPLISTERLRVSAVPQMNDISEHVILEKDVIQDSLPHTSSNFSQQHSPVEKKTSAVLSKQQNRRSSTRSNGKDSGRGSLTPPISSCRFQCFPNESTT